MSAAKEFRILHYMILADAHEPEHMARYRYLWAQGWRVVGGEAIHVSQD